MIILQVTAIKCNFVKSPLPGTERISTAGGFYPPYNLLNKNYRRIKRNNPLNAELFDCEEEVLPEDRNYTYVPM